MILYELRCSGDHAFEAWFKSSAAYDEQAGAGAVICPVCGDNAVRKAPMAPRIAKGRGASRDGRRVPDAGESRDAADAPAQAPEGAGDAPAAAPGADAGAAAGRYAHARSAGMRQALAELRRRVEETCDYVGPRFAEEARRIHSGEADERNIYGEATDAEAEALADEGIEIGKIPWLPRTDS